ncbi:MAG: hypothetical protein AAGJ37_17765 [Pseudomonadota bacterium]
MIIIFYEFALALIFGGMIAFQVLFAPLLFIKLEMHIARAFIRAFFPWYYVYFGVLTLLATMFGFIIGFIHASIALGICFIGFVFSRQYLMRRANDSTDSGNKKRFALFHRATVIINTLQLAVIGYLLYA